MTICPGGALILYTDGITDAQNERGDFYDLARLLQSAQSRLGLTGEEMAAGILADVNRFGGDLLPFDDIALLVITRSPPVGRQTWNREA